MHWPRRRAANRHPPEPMFDKLRQSLENLVNSAASASPEERRAAVSHMKDTLVKARLGV